MISGVGILSLARIPSTFGNSPFIVHIGSMRDSLPPNKRVRSFFGGYPFQAGKQGHPFLPVWGWSNLQRRVRVGPSAKSRVPSAPLNRIRAGASRRGKKPRPKELAKLSVLCEFSKEHPLNVEPVQGGPNWGGFPLLTLHFYRSMAKHVGHEIACKPCPAF